MYSLDCRHYNKEFPSIELLIQDLISCGADPNYEITLNGKRTGDMAVDLIVF